MIEPVDDVLPLVLHQVQPVQQVKTRDGKIGDGDPLGVKVGQGAGKDVEGALQELCMTSGGQL